MTTVFPGAKDSLPRPAANTKTNAGGGLNLSTVLDNISDAIEAIEDQALVRNMELIINGNYDHWQRVGGSAQTCTTTYSALTSYGPDRLFTLPAGASVTVVRGAGGATVAARYHAAITGATSVTTVDHGQRISADIVNTRGRQSLVFSCYVFNNSGAAFIPNLRVGTPAAADDFTTITNRLDQALQSCPNGVWTRVSHVFNPSGYTNIANGMEVALRIPSGSLNSGAKSVLVSHMSLDPGAALAAYRAPDPDLELLRCWRYCQMLDVDTATDQFSVGQVYATTAAVCPIRLPVRMRATPTLSVSSAGHFSVWNSAATPITATNVTINRATPDIVGLDIAVASGLVAGNATYLVANNISAKLTFLAEL